ncbi:uncharacterized protein [Ptychodera flava]|uniref:uncharacterized protein n=1 Tax=Ptychodera flava TaxID=63121 RepID=UPI00396A4A62
MKPLVVVLLVASVLFVGGETSAVRRVEKRDDADDKVYFIGVTTDNKVIYREEDGKWVKSAHNSCCVLAVAAVAGGVVVGVGTDHQLYEWKSRGGVWSWTGPLPNSCCVKDISVTNSGLLLGINLENRLVMRSSATSPWFVAPKSACCVTSVENDPTGLLFGTATNGKVRMRDNLFRGSWQRVSINGPTLRDLATHQGDTYGLSEDGCKIYHLEKDEMEWGDDINDGTCLVSISILVNPEYVEGVLEE